MERKKTLLVVGGSLTVAVATCPIWFQTIIEEIPDRYIVAYAPQWIQATAFAKVDAPLPQISTNSQQTNTATPPIILTETHIPSPTNHTAIPIETEQTTETLPISVIPESAPEIVHQGWNNCGPATITSLLAYMGVEFPRTENGEYSQKEAADFTKPNKEDRQVAPNELIEFAKTKGVNGQVRYNGTKEKLQELIANGFSPVVEVGYEPPGREDDWTSHYLSVYGYDSNRRVFLIRDSYRDTNIEIDYDTLDFYWQQFNWEYLVFYYPNLEEKVNTIIGEDNSSVYEAALKRASQLPPENPHTWFTVGTNLVKLGRYDEAVIAFETAQQLGIYNIPDGSWRILWYQSGPFEAYLNTENYQKAINLADWVLANNEYSEEAHYWKGMALLAKGEPDRAKNQFLDALQLNYKYQPAIEALEVYFP